MSYRSTPLDMTRMPPGIPWIIGNEAAERFSFYGMRAILTVFMAQYLWLLDGPGGSAATEQFKAAVKHLPADWQDSPHNIVLPGHDGMTGTDDDFIARFEDGSLDRIEMPAEPILGKAAGTIETLARENEHRPPATDSIPDLGNDPWDSPLEYEIIDADTVRVSSNGPDRKPGTQWDVGVTLTFARPAEPDKPSWTDSLRPKISWLDRRRQELGVDTAPSTDSGTTYKQDYWSGGHSRLEGASYFRLFTWLMLGTAVVFVPFSILYKPHTYLQK